MVRFHNTHMTPTDPPSNPNPHLRNLLERNLPRTLDEQVQHAYMQLLGKLETAIAKAVTEVDRLRQEGQDDAAEPLQELVDDLTFAWSKNVALKTKVTHRG
jgi:hypothetical protein